MKKLFQNKKTRAAIIAVLALIVVVGIVLLATGGREKTVPEQANTAGADSAAQVNQSPVGDGESAADSTEGEEQTSQAADDSSAVEQPQEEEKTEDDSQTQSGSSSGSASSTKPSSGSQQSGSSAAQEPEPEPISFPYQVPESGLVIEDIRGYDGPYLEDGGDDDVTGVAAAIVKNQGSVDVEYAKLELEIGGQNLSFVLSDLPAGESVAVQEANRAQLPSGECFSCLAEIAENNLEQSEGLITVEEQSSGRLLVTNISGSDIACVRIFYKYYMEEEGSYLGGITFTAKLTELGAGQSMKVMPSHYLAGYSKVVMVRTYDTTD